MSCNEISNLKVKGGEKIDSFNKKATEDEKCCSENNNSGRDVKLKKINAIKRRRVRKEL
jgi:hypothetical protein